MTQQVATLEEVARIKGYLQAQGLNDLWEGLMVLYSVQSVTSTLTPECIPGPDEAPTQDQLRTYFLALYIELGELLQELSWKPWKEVKDVDTARAVDEFADVLAFLGIIIVYMQRLGMSPRALAAAYSDKTHINIDRFLGKVAGYKIKKEVRLQQATFIPRTYRRRSK